MAYGVNFAPDVCMCICLCSFVCALCVHACVLCVCLVHVCLCVCSNAPVLCVCVHVYAQARMYREVYNGIICHFPCNLFLTLCLSWPLTGQTGWPMRFEDPPPLPPSAEF